MVAARGQCSREALNGSRTATTPRIYAVSRSGFFRHWQISVRSINRPLQIPGSPRDTGARLGQGDKIDPRVLLSSGDMSLANLGVQIQNRQQDQERQARQDAFQREQAAEAQRTQTVAPLGFRFARQIVPTRTNSP